MAGSASKQIVRPFQRVHVMSDPSLRTVTVKSLHPESPHSQIKTARAPSLNHAACAIERFPVVGGRQRGPLNHDLDGIAWCPALPEG
jgi:hypothetical protein